MKNNRIRYITRGAIIAAIYAVLTIATWQFSSLAIQCRVSESLCVLYTMLPEAVPGIFVGCLISNMFSGTIVDIVFGSFATLLAGIITRKMGQKMGKRCKWLVPLPTVLVNTLIIPFVLMYGYGITEFGGVSATAGVLGMLALSIFIGETISCYVIGIPLMKFFEKMKLKERLG